MVKMVPLNICIDKRAKEIIVEHLGEYEEFLEEMIDGGKPKIPFMKLADVVDEKNLVINTITQIENLPEC